LVYSEVDPLVNQDYIVTPAAEQRLGKGDTVEYFVSKPKDRRITAICVRIVKKGATELDVP
jgi:hypothetical protein